VADVQYLGAGTLAVTQSSTSPSLPAVTFQANDYLVMFDAVLVTGVLNMPTTPAGWSIKSQYTYTGPNAKICITLYHRRWTSGMAAPTVVWVESGTSEHVSRIFALRGVSANADPTALINAPNSFSASQSAAGPINGLTGVPAGSLVFVLCERDNDMTDGSAGFNVLTGDGLTWVEVLDWGSTSAGAELGAAVNYAIVPTGQNVTSKTFTISGNSATAAAGMGLMWAIAPLQVSITPAGIPSAEAFGTPTIAAGVVTADVAGGGIPTAEAFGTPIVAYAQSIDGVGGIPTAEAVGTPTLTPGTAVLLPAGIPSAQAFGAPTIVPGLATINLDTLSKGIPSAEAFGTPLLSYGIAETDLPKAYPRTEIPYPAVSYELVAVARVPQTSGPPLLIEVDPIVWTGLSYTEELSKPGTMSAGVNIASLTEPVLQRLRDMESLPTELWLYRQGALIFAGPLLGFQVQSESLTLQAQGLGYYMQWWYLLNDIVVSGVDQAAIVKAMCDQWQSQDYGNFGLNTSNIANTGVLRDRSYIAVEGHKIGQRVEELGKAENGFDMEVDPHSRDIRLWYPTQGVDRSEGEDAIIFDSRNVTSGNIVAACTPATVASESIGVGTSRDAPLSSIQSNLELRAKFGRSAIWTTFDGVTEATTLADHTRAVLNSHADALLVPGPEVRTTADADISAYGVGDVVKYQLHQRLGVTGSYRVRKRTISVSKIGREKTSVEFV
jgi:hypothetical protein